MALTSRKPRPLDRSVAHLGDTLLIIIATEGRVTEKQYFSIFSSTRVQIKILATGEDNCSSPEHVLDRLKQFSNEFELSGDDELWLMVDVDRWGDKKLSDISRESTNCGFHLAVSNPCFETWLLCHFSDPPISEQSCNDIIALLRKELDGSYNKNNLNLEKFQPLVDQAINRAKSNDKTPKFRWPHIIGSHVYRVFKNIPSGD